MVLAGEAFVGKTHIVYRYIKGSGSPNENFKNIGPTVGV